MNYRITIRILFAIIFLFFLYVSVGGFWMLKKTKEASERLITTVLIEGSEGTKTYLPRITMLPPEFYMTDVDLTGKQGYMDGLKWYEFEFKAQRVRFSTSDVIRNKYPKVMEIRNVSFVGKMPFDGVSVVLKKSNPEWDEVKIGRLGDEGEVIYLYARDIERDISFNVFGRFTIDKDGYLLMIPIEQKYFIGEGKMDLDKWESDLHGFEPSISFNYFGIRIPMNRAAVSEQGIYIEAGDIQQGETGDPTKLPWEQNPE